MRTRIHSIAVRGDPPIAVDSRLSLARAAISPCTILRSTRMPGVSGG